jgi:hypothetical protein
MPAISQQLLIPTVKLRPVLLRSTMAVLIVGLIGVIARESSHPHSNAMPGGFLPALFGTFLAAFVIVDYRCTQVRSSGSVSRRAAIRRSTWLIYLWMYLLAGTSGLSAWSNDDSFVSGAGSMGRFLVAAVIVVVVIRIVASMTPDRLAGDSIHAEKGTQNE